MPSRVRKNEDRVEIVGVRRKNKNDRFDEVWVYCRLGSLKFTVSLPSEEFTFARLKSEIATRLLCEFGARCARSLVGREIPITEIIKESDAAKNKLKFRDLF